MKIENNIISVPIGMLIKRLSDGSLLGRRYALGYLYYLDGKRLEKPIKEQFADFCEVKDDNYTEGSLDCISDNDVSIATDEELRYIVRLAAAEIRSLRVEIEKLKK